MVWVVCCVGKITSVLHKRILASLIRFTRYGKIRSYFDLQ